jgi:hypothetical protein
MSSGKAFVVLGSTVFGIGILLLLEKAISKVPTKEKPSGTAVTQKPKTAEEKEKLDERRKQYEIFHAMSP